MKNEKEKISKKRNTSESNKKYMALSILIIMVVSVVAFAFISRTGHDDNSQNSGRDIPLGLNYQDNQGNTYYGARINGEDFIFREGIEGFEGIESSRQLAEKIKTKEILKIYVDKNFTSGDAVYLIEKSLNVLEITHTRIDELNCDSETLVITNENNFEGECLVFESPKGEENYLSQALVYHIIKDY